MKKQYGIIGFFDILGFQNFLENNDPEVAADIVRKALLYLVQGSTKDSNHFVPVLSDTMVWPKKIAIEWRPAIHTWITIMYLSMLLSTI